jgi:hypothetical protein
LGGDERGTAPTVTYSAAERLPFYEYSVFFFCGMDGLAG